MLLIGYDIGSSSIKAAIFDAAKNQTIGVTSYPESEMDMISRQSGWAEQQPEIWWQDLIYATRKLLTDTGVNGKEIRGIGLSYQMHGLVLVDKDKHVLRPSIIWCDSRGVEIGKKALDEMGADYCFENLLNAPGNFTASKLKWVKDNEPDIYQKTDKFMLPGDYIAMKLTEECRTTSAGLSEGIFWDFQQTGVSNEVLDYYDFDRDLIPEQVPILGEQGMLSQMAADMLGLKAGTLVTFRAGDQPCNALALNVLKPNEIAATSGTSGVVYGVVDRPIYDKKSRVNSFAHVNYETNHDRIGVLLCLNGAGIQYSWMKHQVARGDRNYTDMERMVSTVPIGSDGLCILPFGNGAERMFENRNVNSHIFNIEFTRHNRAHLYRAALEGVAFSFVRGINVLKELGLNVDVLRVGNDNMFQSEVFASTIATMLDCHIEMVDSTGAIGAARAAGVGIGAFSSLEEAMMGVTTEKIYEPRLNKALVSQAYNFWESCLGNVLSPSQSGPKASTDSLKNQILTQEKLISDREKQLATTNLKLQSKDDFLGEIRKELKDLSKQLDDKTRTRLERLSRKIESNLNTDSWKSFEEHFEMIHTDFFKNLKGNYPELSTEEIKLLAYLKMQVTTKDIAQKLNLSVRGVETRRYRIRKKLNLAKNQGLDQFLAGV
ncbi:MAG: FGGY family carbohydrate kinase [Cytophagales bacterium]|nr:FGGY family carbohydrate kinase [Cytophagales bacterium]